MEHTDTAPAPGTLLGLHRYSVPAQPPRASRLEITVLLIAGAVGDYAAYRWHGPPRWGKGAGDKLPFEEARHYLPGIKGELYRE